MGYIKLDKFSNNCFAFVGTKETECLALTEECCPLRVNGKCKFYKSVPELAYERAKAAISVKLLPKEQRDHIMEKYGDEFLK